MPQPCIGVVARVLRIKRSRVPRRTSEEESVMAKQLPIVGFLQLANMATSCRNSRGERKPGSEFAPRGPSAGFRGAGSDDFSLGMCELAASNVSYAGSMSRRQVRGRKPMDARGSAERI